METEAKLNVFNQDLAFQCWGDSQKPWMVALHGWLDNSESFRALAQALPQYYWVALDLPGHGHSAPFSSGLPYHFVDGALLILGALRAWNQPQVHLLGHSMGGGMATLVAGTAPHWIQGLILLDGLGPLSTSSEEAPHRLWQAAETLWNPPHSSRPSKEFSEMVQRKSKALHVPEEYLEKLVGRGTKETSNGWVWSHDPRLQLPSSLRLDESQVRAFLSNITCPTLLVRPNRGWPYEPSIMEKRIKSFRDLRIQEVDGGHHLHMEDPSTVANLIQNFHSNLTEKEMS